MRISKQKLYALQNLAAGPWWSLMMTAEFYQLATALEKLGLVKFTQRVTRSGRLDGHDATATQEGLRLLKQHGMLPKHRAHDVD